MTTLDELAAEASGCTRCRLAGGRTQVVFGTGDPAADLMFVGEGPGVEEDRQGLPFVGRSGQLLDKLLEQELAMHRDQCYIANVTKCLDGDAPVQLGDGSWEPIGRLVRDRYGGTVRSVADDGAVVARRVVGWHRSPLAGRRLFRLSHGSAAPAVPAAQPDVHLTEDHPVMTPAGWVPAGSMTPGALVVTGQAPGAFGPARVEEVEPAGADPVVYCVDVEGTHNFVTAGGVVHNCRPPGNRDPLPDEIEACFPYLDQQIGCVGPKVVVTLGNFATRTLLGRSEGITRLRGHAYPFGDAALVPTFHPAAALRGGGEVVAQMRADLVRAKRLLQRPAR